MARIWIPSTVTKRGERKGHWRTTGSTHVPRSAHGAKGRKGGVHRKSGTRVIRSGVGSDATPSMRHTVRMRAQARRGNRIAQEMVGMHKYRKKVRRKSVHRKRARRTRR